jgi:hypothetical protein
LERSSNANGWADRSKDKQQRTPLAAKVRTRFDHAHLVAVRGKGPLPPPVPTPRHRSLKPV